VSLVTTGLALCNQAQKIRFWRQGKHTLPYSYRFYATHWPLNNPKSNFLNFSQFNKDIIQIFNAKVKKFFRFVEVKNKKYVNIYVY